MIDTVGLGRSVAVGEGHRAAVGGVIRSGRGRVGRAVGRCEVDRNSSGATAGSAHREGRRRRLRIPLFTESVAGEIDTPGSACVSAAPVIVILTDSV